MGSNDDTSELPELREVSPEVDNEADELQERTTEVDHKTNEDPVEI